MWPQSWQFWRIIQTWDTSCWKWRMLVSVSLLQMHRGTRGTEVWSWIIWCCFQQNQRLTKQKLKLLRSRFFRMMKDFWQNFHISYFVGNNAKGRILKWVFQENKARQIFHKTNISYQKRRFLTPSEGKKYLFIGKFGVLCFLETPVLRFALFPYYRRFCFWFCYYLVLLFWSIFLNIRIFDFGKRINCPRTILNLSVFPKMLLHSS